MTARPSYRMGRETESVTLQIPAPIVERIQRAAQAKYTSRQAVILRFVIDNIDIIAPEGE